jgi:hypothetical protein
VSYANLQSSRLLSQRHGIKTLVYGGAGAGKTKLVSTAPAPVLISAESGLLSLREFDIPVWQIYSIADMYAAYNWLTQSAEAKQFQTICLDSISEIAEVCLAEAKKRNKDPRAAYGDLIDEMLLLVKGFRDLPNKHIYVSAKMEHYKDDASNTVKYGPSMPGKVVGPALPYLFDEVFHMGVGKDEKGADFRYLRTQLDFQYEAKDRSGVLAPFEQPDLSYLFNKILGAVS